VSEWIPESARSAARCGSSRMQIRRLVIGNGKQKFSAFRHGELCWCTHDGMKIESVLTGTPLRAG
jgi:hypothetical protein